MSIKKNIIANYFGQFYVALIGILLVPVYVKYMGAEAYGLVGFFVMLQSWFFLLDMGLSPTMARETSRYQGGAVDAINLRKLLRALEGLFVFVGIIGAVGIIAASNVIASQWLKVADLPMYEVKSSLVLMAVTVALRWIGGIYRSAITGFERFVWLSVFNIIIATLRFVLIVPILVYVNARPTTFFVYQLLVTFIETLVLVAYTYKLMPKVVFPIVPWDLRPLREPLKFSLTIAFTGMVWVVVTQTDKLMLSGLIPLKDYAYFTLAVLVASGIMIISKPISGALLPRLTILNAENNQTQLIQLYRDATQLISIIAVPAALILSLFSKQVLWAWSGNYELATKASSILALYAIGNGLMTLAAFPYYIQYAKGDLRLHLISNGIFLAIFMPLIYFLVIRFGGLGAGFAWVCVNLIYFVVYVPMAHNKFVKGMHWKWLAVDIGLVGVPPLLLTMTIRQFIELPKDRLALSACLCILLISSMLVAGAASSKTRYLTRQLFRKFN